MTLHRRLSRRVFVLYVMALCVGFVVSGEPTFARDERPHITVPESVFDFGTVPQGQRVVHEFEIRNSGSSDLILQRISPSCGCTAAAVSSPTIKPGAHEKVRVEFDTSGFHGNKTKSIHILTNVLDKPEIVLKLSGTIVRGVSISPERLEFGDLSPSSSIASRTREFTVEVVEGSDLTIAKVTSFSKFVDVSPTRTEPGRNTYTVTVKDGLPKGELRERILVEFKGDRQSGMNVPVTASIGGDLRVNPATVSFGILDGTEVLERRVRFENKSDQMISVSDIESSHPGVTASLVEVKPGKQGVVVIKLDQRKVTGDLRASLSLKTNHPVEQRLALTVVGVKP